MRPGVEDDLASAGAWLAASVALRRLLVRLLLEVADFAATVSGDDGDGAGTPSPEPAPAELELVDSTFLSSRSAS